MTQKVYVVTDGSYSDYHVAAVFSTMEKAVEYSAVFGMNDPLEYELDCEYGIIEQHKGLKYYRVSMDRDGNVGSAFLQPFDEGERTDYIYHDKYDKDALHVYTWAKDEQHAVKIANEKRVQLIAANQWVESEKKPSPFSGVQCFTRTLESHVYSPSVELPEEGE